MIKDFLELLKTEGLPIEGVLLALCAMLIYALTWQNRKINKIEKENKEKDEMIISLIEKYYVISTKTQETIKQITNFLIKNDA